MFEVFIKTHFSAAHHLRNYSGKCANQHGHNWMVTVCCSCVQLNEVGMGVDFVDLKREVGEALMELDHTDLNEMEYFQKFNPTTENVAKYLFETLSKKINTERVRISKVTVYESPQSGATYQL